VLAQPAVASVIVGARTAEQLETNLVASERRLTSEELSALDGASQVPIAYPYRAVNIAAR